MSDQLPSRPSEPPASGVPRPADAAPPPSNAYPPGPGQAAGTPYSPAAGPKTSGLAVASLVLGIAGLCTCGVTSLVGLILGIVALGKVNRSGGTLGGRGVAIGGIVASALTLLLGVALWVATAALHFYADRSVTWLRDMSVQQTLEETAIALEAYRMDVGHYPTEAEGGLEALLRRPPNVPDTAWHGPYLDEVPVDVWGNPLLYEPPDPSRPDLAGFTYRIWSTGPDGAPGTPDDRERE